MKVTEHISKSKRSLFSLELLPPLKGQSISEVFEALDPLMEFQIPFVDVTFHREEVDYKDVGGGLVRRSVVKRRPGTVGICSAIQTRYKIDAIPHVLCGGFTREETENFLIDLSFLEIENVMALRGDAISAESYFTPKNGGNCHANELVRQISNMNNGIYLDSELKYHNPSSFCIGVASYPEKHLEAPSMESDIHFLKQKVRDGAHYVITQMFFDNSRYFEFVEKCRAQGITIPIIPGLKPLSTLKQLNMIPHKFKIDLPDLLVREIVKAPNQQAIKEIGIEWCVQQCRELIDNNVPLIHFYSNGKTESIRRILLKLSQSF